MLLELSVVDYAIIHRLTIPFAEGLNVITGETGAGKSIVIDALGAALGGKASADMVRSGANMARVEAVFDYPESLAARELLTELGIDSAGDEALVLARDIYAAGRTAARVNGRTVSAQLLQQLAAELIDLQTQSEHLSLLRPMYQLDVLDAYADALSLRSVLASQIGELRALQKEAQALELDERERLRQLDLFSFQAQEIEEARLSAGEEDELACQHRILANVEALAGFVREAVSLLEPDTEFDSGALSSLSRASRALEQAANLDSSLTPLVTLLQQASELAADAVTDLRRYSANLELDPDRLREVEERLQLIADLKRKYGATVAEVLSFGANARVKITELNNSESRKDEIRVRVTELHALLAEYAAQLRARRTSAAETLAAEIATQLRELRIERARFSIEVKPARQGGHRVELPGANGGLLLDATGADEVTYLLTANPGEAPRPMSRVASGGELSRVLLAVKIAFAAADKIPSLVFDEIDAGIGGKTGSVVGCKLAELSSRHQLICITHLPQIASFANVHFRISKSTARDDETTVAVARLDEDERVTELATMLSGNESMESARLTARQLLKEARQYGTGESGEQTDG